MKTNLTRIIDNKISDILRLIEEVKESFIEEINSLEEDVKEEVGKNDLLADELSNLETRIEQLELRINNKQQLKTK